MEGLSSSPVTTTWSDCKEQKGTKCRYQECEWVAENVPRDPVLCKEREKDEVPKGTTFSLDKTKYRPKLALFFLCSNTGLSTAEPDLSSPIGKIEGGQWTRGTLRVGGRSPTRTPIQEIKQPSGARAIAQKRGSLPCTWLTQVRYPAAHMVQ